MMSKTETMSRPYRYWLALHPDIRRPIGGVKQVHRLAEALNHFGRKATIIQEDASFHMVGSQVTYLRSVILI